MDIHSIEFKFNDDNCATRSGTITIEFGESIEGYPAEILDVMFDVTRALSIDVWGNMLYLVGCFDDVHRTVRLVANTFKVLGELDIESRPAIRVTSAEELLLA